MSAWGLSEARELARELVMGMGSRWSHLCAVGQLAEDLADRTDLVSAEVVAASWVHDIGYAPELVDSGMHAIDGAEALERIGAPRSVAALVAHHTGADVEARVRGLSTRWSALAIPAAADLDVLTLLDLSTSPTGQPVRSVERIAEILRRYEPGHVVHRAVSSSGADLEATAVRARAALGLPALWPSCGR